MHDYLGVASRSREKINLLTKEVVEKKAEFEMTSFYRTYTKNALTALPYLTTAIVNKAMNEMEKNGYVFAKKKAGSVEKYALTNENIIDIYAHRGFKKYRDRRTGAFTIFISNLNSGVSKTVSTVSIAHALRNHPQLIKEDLRVLVIDLDPQASATMFLNHTQSIGSIETTAIQAMLQNVNRKELIEEYIVKSIVPNVDLMPSSIEDAFVTSDWVRLCSRYLKGQNEHSLLRENIINKLVDDYDFIFVDCGPHLDALMTNSLAAADLLLTPTPPSQVDFYSTLKYLSRLPELFNMIEKSGCPLKAIANIGFMVKMAKKIDHQICMSFAKEIFQTNMLDATLPRSDAFERVGESFDTVISCAPPTYAGNLKSLTNAKDATNAFAAALFDRIEILRTIGQ